MTILPKIRTRYGENIGVEIFVTPPFLDDNNTTFLDSDAASGVSSFTVDNGLKFAVGQYVLIGSIGSEKSEIIKVHAVTTPTATTLTLASNTSFAHNRGEKITFIPYNQIVLEASTDGGSVYSVLATVNIRADSAETYYNQTAGLSTYYYRAKFSNSATSDVSQISDVLIATGYAENSVGSVIREALVSLGEELDTVITKEFLYSALNEGRDELDKMPGVERWSYRTSFDYDAGNVIPGQNTLSLPSSLREGDTYKNILSVRIGRNNLPLTKVDKRALNRWYQGVARSTLNGAVTSGSTSVILTSSGDFDESGAVVIAGEAIGEETDTVDYTSNDPATATLGGATNIRGAGHSSGAVVWQGAAFGIPVEYTVFENKVVFSQPFGNDIGGENIWLDFYTDITTINSDGDVLDEPNYKMFIPYLRYRIKKRRDKKMKDADDSDFTAWQAKRNAAVAKEFTGQDVRLRVDIP